MRTRPPETAPDDVRDEIKSVPEMRAASTVVRNTLDDATKRGGDAAAAVISEERALRASDHDEWANGRAKYELTLPLRRGSRGGP